MISLLEDQEVRDLELSEEAAVVIAAGMSFQRFLITERGVPASRHQTELLCNDLAAKVHGGRSVAVHCRAGIGRSGWLRPARPIPNTKAMPLNATMNHANCGIAVCSPPLQHYQGTGVYLGVAFNNCNPLAWLR